MWETSVGRNGNNSEISPPVVNERERERERERDREGGREIEREGEPGRQIESERKTKADAPTAVLPVVSASHMACVRAAHPVPFTRPSDALGRRGWRSFRASTILYS